MTKHNLGPDQTWENGKKPSFRSNFGPFDPNMGSYNSFLQTLPPLDVRYFSWVSRSLMLQIVASHACMKFQRNLMNQTWENRKKPSLWPYFNPFGPKIFRTHSKLSLYTISRKTNEPNMRNWKKKLVLDPILTH